MVAGAGRSYLPGGQCAWVAPARDRTGRKLVLKVGWRHWEAEHEADALCLWDGAGVVHCLAARTFDDTAALLLERCVPGVALKDVLPEPEQDFVLAGLLRRLWQHQPPAGNPFRPLREICDQWADSFEVDFSTDSRGLDRAIAPDGIAVLRELPRSADRAVSAVFPIPASPVSVTTRLPPARTSSSSATSAVHSGSRPRRTREGLLTAVACQRE